MGAGLGGKGPSLRTLGGGENGEEEEKRNGLHLEVGK